MSDLVNMRAIDEALELTCEQYGTTAPTVARWADDLSVRLYDEPDKVPLCEIVALKELHEDNEWMQPNLAANYIYKLMVRLGRDVTGQVGF